MGCNAEISQQENAFSKQPNEAFAPIPNNNKNPISVQEGITKCTNPKGAVKTVVQNAE